MQANQNQIKMYFLTSQVLFDHKQPAEQIISSEGKCLAIYSPMINSFCVLIWLMKAHYSQCKVELSEPLSGSESCLLHELFLALVSSAKFNLCKFFFLDVNVDLLNLKSVLYIQGYIFYQQI